MKQQDKHSATLPECMAPDGADPCNAYQTLKVENDFLNEINKLHINLEKGKNKAIDGLIAALEECNEYLADLADADQPSGSHPIANREMRLMIDAEAAIKNAKRLLP